MLHLLVSPTTKISLRTVWYDREGHVLITGAKEDEMGLRFVLRLRGRLAFYGFDTFLTERYLEYVALE